MTKKDVEKLREMGKSNEEIAQITGDMSVLEEIDIEKTEDTVETDAEETEAAEEDAENVEDVEMTANADRVRPLASACGFPLSKSEARDYVDEQIDEEFMEDVCEQKMSPEKAAKKIKEYEEEIEKLNERIKVISPIADLPNLDILKDLIKEQTIKAVENMTTYDMKESSKSAKAGISGLESIAFTEGLLRTVRSELSSKKQRVEFCEKEIANLKAQGFQTNLFDKANKEENSEENVEVKEENQEEVGE